MRPGEGPVPAKIMLVGEAYGENEERQLRPFVGASGHELNRMLQEAGLLRSAVYVTNLVNARPPNNDLGAWIAMKKKDITSSHVPLRDKMVLPVLVEGYASLRKEIELVGPEVIVPVGNSAMWALTGAWGITKWRGSVLSSDITRATIIPTFHPAGVLRQWDWRQVVINDFRRVKQVAENGAATPPQYNFTLRPSFQLTIDRFILLYDALQGGEQWLDLDLETRSGHIACAGISWSTTEAICIPFMCVERKEGFWQAEEETQIIWWLYRVLTHRNARVRLQNGLYDAQYTWRHWHFVPRVAQDTMIAQHSTFCALPKSLAFQASMYAKHYVFWKDEGKTWDRHTGEEQLWNYNCLDCVYTREVGEAHQRNLKSLGLADVDAVQQSLFWPVLRAMQVGVRILPANRTKLVNDIQTELSAREDFLRSIVGHDINVASPIQIQGLFYDDLQQKPILKREKVDGRWQYRPTCNDDALNKIGQREPILKPITNCIADIRTLRKWLKDFVLMEVDDDGRMRCSFNIAGDAAGKSAPYSYRLSSSENAFGSGGNLQTIPSEKSKSAGKAAARGSMEFDLPNIRSMYGPDPGFTFFDMDLDRADLHVFVWEIEDELYKEVLRKGVDAHLLHVYLLDGKEPPPLEELVESHPKYPDHRGPRKHLREFSKVFCHATDYLGQAKTVSEHTGRSVHEIDRAQKRYLQIHPKIEPYWKRVDQQVKQKRYVENKFGYRWYVFDRLDDILPEAIAWIPQSSVGCTINRIWLNLYKHLPEVMVLLQVHDSLAGQFPTHRKAELLPKILELSKISVPYEDPLIIPVGVKTSEISWGECK